MPRYFSAIRSALLSVSSGGVAPELLAHLLVQPLGEGLGEAVGQRLDHDRGVVVVGVLEAVGDLVLADAGRHHEGADVIGVALRRDEVRQRHVGAAFAPRKLLAQRVQGRDRLPRDASPNTACRRPTSSPARSRRRPRP